MWAVLFLGPLPVCAVFLFDVFPGAVLPGELLLLGWLYSGLILFFWRLLSPETGAASVMATHLVHGHPELGVPVGQAGETWEPIRFQRQRKPWVWVIHPGRVSGNEDRGPHLSGLWKQQILSCTLVKGSQDTSERTIPSEKKTKGENLEEGWVQGKWCIRHNIKTSREGLENG